MRNKRRTLAPQVRVGTTTRGPAKARGETHEPQVPVNWPDGHVGVELTGDEIDECFIVRIHDVTHYLHTTTTRELYWILGSQLEAFDEKLKEHDLGHLRDL